MILINHSCVYGTVCKNGVCINADLGCGCSVDADCGNDDICVNGSCSDVNRYVGNPCTDSRQCQGMTNLTCSNGTCVGTLPAGVTCQPIPDLGSNCIPPLYCSYDYVCRSYVAVGGACGSSTEFCDNSSYCSPAGVCTATTAIGTNCTTGSTCASTVCYNGITFLCCNH